MKTRLTATSTASLRRCLRQYYYRFELGLARVRQATPLRFGQVFHKGLELRHGLFGQDTQALLDNVLSDYAVAPAWADATDWAVEHETLRALLTGHLWRYGNDNVTFVAVEQAFEIPLVNVATGYPSRKFCLAGKIDGVVRLPDGRLAVLEYKTTSEDVAQSGDYWLRLRCDGQISQYVLAARAIGHEVATVLYDVTRKPTIRLRKEETPEEFGKRLVADIGERPDHYFQRREVPRLEDDLAQYRAELWEHAQLLMAIRHRAARLADPSTAWFRNVSKLTCGHCEYAGFCFDCPRVDPANLPSGFQRLENVHPELSE